jgi:hypothetical protein
VSVTALLIHSAHPWEDVAFDPQPYSLAGGCEWDRVGFDQDIGPTSQPSADSEPITFRDIILRQFIKNRIAELKLLRGQVQSFSGF